MSAFCIHGVSRARCLDLAKKKAEVSLLRPDRKFIRRLTEAEWEFAVGLYAACLFSRAKPSAVSPRFDAPQYAQIWLDVAARAGDIRDAVLMALQPTGQRDPKTKEVILKWLPYAGPRAAA